MPSSEIPHRPDTASRLVAVSLALGIGLLPLSQGAAAEVYKCVNSAGATEFSDAPCSRGSQGHRVEVRPNTLDTSGAREQSLRAENQQLQQKLNTAQAGNQPPANTAAPDASRVDSFACKQAKRDLEITASSIDKDPAMLRARQSAMYGACGLREPDQQTTNIRIQNAPNRPVTPRP